MQHEVSFGNDATLLELIGLDDIVRKSRNYYPSVYLIYFFDFLQNSFADDVAIEEMVVLTSKQHVQIDETEVEFGRECSRQPRPLFLVVALKADDSSTIAFLEIVDKVGERLFRTFEE